MKSEPESHIRPLKPLQDFIRTEAASGVFLLIAVVAALLWANGPFEASYVKFSNTELSLSVGRYHLGLSLKHFVNEGLMTVFFFVVGLEIKRELTHGQLREFRKAIVPVIAAFGGMIVPPLLYAAVNVGHSSLNGWAIPMATDIAIVLALLAIAGPRIPPMLKTFLLTLAIVDDIGAIVVVAAFYSNEIDARWLLAVALLLSLVWILRKSGVRPSLVYVALGLGAWLAAYSAGIHATLIGVAMALLTPSRPMRKPQYFDAETLADVSSLAAASETVSLAKDSISELEWLEHLLHPWSSYVVLPFFVLVNAGVALNLGEIGDALSFPVAVGISFGLIVGKPVGILLATWFGVRVLKLSLPEGVSLRYLFSGAVLCGVGFTVSLFIADLSFSRDIYAQQATIGILFASTISGILGFLLLKATSRTDRVNNPN